MKWNARFHTGMFTIKLFAKIDALLEVWGAGCQFSTRRKVCLATRARPVPFAS